MESHGIGGAAGMGMEMEKFVKDGNEAVEFKLVRTLKDVEDPKLSFHPAMCHQIFGEGETIFGYENLSIQLYFTAGSLVPYVGIKYSKKVESQEDDGDGVEADDLMSKLTLSLPPSNYNTNFDIFTGLIEKESRDFKPLGDLVYAFEKEKKSVKEFENAQQQNGASNGGANADSSFSLTNGVSGDGNSNLPSKYEIYYCDIRKSAKFISYLERMESFVLWFIDAASKLSDGGGEAKDDDKWGFFIIYEKYPTPEGTVSYAFIGYSAVYNFYCYPDSIRPRIAQMIILPPFQKQGLGVQLLKCVYQYYRTNGEKKNVIEITVEDPSDSFEELRDYVDALDCMTLPSFSAENLKTGYSNCMKDEAGKVLKITARQSRRVYEILRLRQTNVNDEMEFKKFRLDVKERLNVPYKKQQKDIERLKKKNFNTAELQKAEILDEASRITELESNFQNLYTHYQKIIKRIEMYMD